MKVLFLTENYYRGGLDTFLIALINNWPYPEDDLLLICNRSHPGLETIASQLRRPCKIKTHNLTWIRSLGRPVSPGGSSILFKLTNFLSTLLRKALSYPFFFYYLHALVREFKRLEYDRLMVVNGGYPGGMTCRAATVAWGLAGLKPLSIHNFHNFADDIQQPRAIIENLIDGLVRRYCRVMVSVSRVCADSLATRNKFGRLFPCRVIYNGIDQSAIHGMADTDIRHELEIPGDAPLCLMLATYEPRKGHEFFIKAFRLVVGRMSSARALICGYGSVEEIQHVRELVERHGLAGHIRLETYRTDVANLLGSADVLVVPSQSYESFGLVIVEAMARGMPVVATRVGGIPEVVVDGESGFLCDADDPDMFASLIIRVLENPQLHEEVGKKATQRYKACFTAERMAREYAELIRSVD